MVLMTGGRTSSGAAAFTPLFPVYGSRFPYSSSGATSGRHRQQ